MIMTILVDGLTGVAALALAFVVGWILWYLGLAILFGFIALTDGQTWQRVSDNQFRRQLAKIERQAGWCPCGQALCPGCRHGAAVGRLHRRQRSIRTRSHTAEIDGARWTVRCRRYRVMTTGSLPVSPDCWYCECESSGLSTRRQIRRGLRGHDHPASAWWIRRMRLDGDQEGLRMRGLIVRHRSW